MISDALSLTPVRVVHARLLDRVGLPRPGGNPAVGGLKAPVILAAGVLEDLELRFSRHDRLPGGRAVAGPLPEMLPPCARARGGSGGRIHTRAGWRWRDPEIIPAGPVTGPRRPATRRRCGGAPGPAPHARLNLVL